MRTSFDWRLSLSVIALVVSANSVAEAQAWLEAPRRNDGPGLRTGEFVFHPGIATEIGYDTNVFYEDEDRQDSAILRVTPHLWLQTLSGQRLGGEGEDAAPRAPPKIKFKAGLTGSYYHHFGTYYDDNVSTSADVNLVINPDRPFSVTVYDTFTRSIRPFSEPGWMRPNYARDRNVVGVDLGFASPGGLLKSSLGYAFRFDFFEDENFSDNNSFTHTVSSNSSWQFLPKTALLHRLSLGFQNYPNYDPTSVSQLNDNVRLKTAMGVNGVLTPRVSMTALIGYGAGFYEDAADYEDVNGRLEARWRATEKFAWTFGYERGYESSFLGNFNRRDRGYTKATLTVGAALLLGAKLSAGLYHYGVPRDGAGVPLAEGDTEEERDDIRLNAGLFGEYRILDWLATTAELGYQANFTDFEYEVETGDPLDPSYLEPAGYHKIEAWLGVRAFY
jgi:hypothetical protein